MRTPRINHFHNFLKQAYGCRVQKLCLDGGFTCPNRDGSKATGGCYFCDASGSGAAHIVSAEPISEQLKSQKLRCQQRYGAVKFIAYFQAFTNTYAPIERLRMLYDQATSDPDVIGLSVGTRADCISEKVCELLRGYQCQGKRVWVEIGVQTINQTTLERMNRAETVEDYRRAARLIKEANLELVAHVIVGLPGDTRDDFLRTVEFLNEIHADGAKIHNLYIDARAALARWWREGRCQLLDFDEYINLVADGLESLAPNCVIHRLSGQAPRPFHLAPHWALDKNFIIQKIESELERRGTRHGSRWVSALSHESC
ncbi:MAG: TIGR01212 family radical SAM protein [Candidatus Sumerlaeaceae bacterium]